MVYHFFCFLFFFFFKQKTAYEMRISDWSSDVCSSDLALGRVDVVASAPGKLVPANDVKLIQPGAAGIVHAILVRDGQRVRAGQPLVELDPTVSDADTEIGRAHV